MANPIVHWEITSSDGKPLHDFYGRMFDWDIDTHNEYDYGMVNTKGGVNGGISGSPAGNMVTIYVEVDDLQAALDKAESLGGKTIMPPMDIPGAVSMAQFADPAGNVIGLVKSGSMVAG
jgi:predicted enzyme related to lactoylglutathione lyase